MEILQVILIVTLILLCITLTALAVYSIFVLKDMKEALENAKEVSKTVRKLSNYVVAPMMTVASLLGSVTKGLRTVKNISSMFNENEDDEEEEE